ncbi:MAG: TRAP transporter TatT component family protein [bacterium]
MKLKRLAGLIAFVAVITCAFVTEAREPEKATSDNPQAQEYIDKAWNAVDENINMQNVKEAVKYLEKARKLDPKNPEILIELADQYYYRGELMPRETDEDYEARNKWFKKGMEAAQKALEIKENAAAHYWIAANKAAMNENASIFTQIRMFPSLMGHMEWIEEHNPDYKYGAEARFWSRVAARVPGPVQSAVGMGPEDVYPKLDKAIKSEPRFIDNYVYKAEFLYAMDKKEQALEVLDKALQMDPAAFPKEKAYNKYAQKRARKHWKEWTGKEYPSR